MSNYIMGALTMLVGTIVGYVMGLVKPYLDRRFNRPKLPGGTP